MVVSWIRRLPERSVSPTVWDGGGQTGSFPFSEVSSYYEPSESCETNIRKRPGCPRVSRVSTPCDGPFHVRVAGLPGLARSETPQSARREDEGEAPYAAHPPQFPDECEAASGLGDSPL